MSHRWTVSTSVLITIVVLLMVVPVNGQTPAARPPAPQVPRMPDGKPNLTGLWEALGTAYWDIRDHSAQPGPFFQLGAIGAIPGGQGIVENGESPYKAEAAARRKRNFTDAMRLDPAV